VGHYSHLIAYYLSIITGLLALVGSSYFLRTYGWRKRSTPSHLLTSEATGQSSQAKEGASEVDRELLNEYEWVTYKGLLPKMKTAIEIDLVKSIIIQKFPNLTEDEATKACSQLLRDETFRAQLLSCWEEGSFELLRSHGMFFKD
jgi:hypothetical protein